MLIKFVLRIRTDPIDVNMHSAHDVAALLRALAINHAPILTNVQFDELAETYVGRLPEQSNDNYEIVSLLAKTCAYKVQEHDDYDALAGRVLMSYLHARRGFSFVEKTLLQRSNVSSQRQRRSLPLVSEEYAERVAGVSAIIENTIDYELDYTYGFFATQTLLKGYLLREGGFAAPGEEANVMETAQDNLMRYTCFLNVEMSVDKTTGMKTFWVNKDWLATYRAIAEKLCTPASPSLFNPGTLYPQMSSCFLLDVFDDSIDGGITKVWRDTAGISRLGGGIGVSLSKVRAKGSDIRGTNGVSSGIVPMLRVCNDISVYVNQSGRRKGAFAMYLEPWHPDVFDFLQLRLSVGKEEQRTRDLFIALWIPDLFMRRLESGQPWSLMCPSDAPGLDEVWGVEFEALYERYEREGKATRQVQPLEVWKAAVVSLIETGTPYLLMKDTANRLSNQRHLGTTKSSNLCVAPETKILTISGYAEMRELWKHGKEVDVWNGEDFSAVKVMRTNADSPLLTIHFSQGSTLRCTPYHRFYVRGPTYELTGQTLPTNLTECPAVRVVEARHLRCGDVLVDFALPPTLQLQEVKNLPFDARRQDKVFVTHVEDLGERDETFCVNEPRRHAVVFNGVLTGNCCEIIEYTSHDEIAVCNLSSIALPRFVSDDRKTFNFDKLSQITRLVVRNLNRVIDRTYYPRPEARNSNLRHRPMGVGVQGLADTFALLRMPFDSPEARRLNCEIFECIYFSALDQSCETAAKEGPHQSYPGSPMSRGILHHDQFPATTVKLSGRWDWATLRERIRQYGVRNSLLVALMPTASTANILGNNESFEPFYSMLHSRRVLSGDFMVVCSHLVRDLTTLGLWNDQMYQRILRAGGSVQSIVEIPPELRAIYRTVWEIPHRSVMEMAADRAPFVDQSQSLNTCMAKPTLEKLTSALFFGWRNNLVTCSYYLRTKPLVEAEPVTVGRAGATPGALTKKATCDAPDGEVCTSCSS
jgi:ribonucleotide reductase alpha subunit